ncbi:MAG TPA: histidine kinase [Bacteroidales bacterium]|nr:histidine kinase [Bacteroidales bacterium]
MTYRPKIRKIFFSSWFLALGPAIILSLFIPKSGSEYVLETETVKDRYIQSMYADLNSDSVTELITLDRGVPYYFLSIRSPELKMYDQWNLHDSIDNNISGIFTGNCDHDRYTEIFIFTHKADSLFLNFYEMIDPAGLRGERLFVTKIGYHSREVASTLFPAGFFDEDGDGTDELYFTITSSFRLGPRKVNSYNLRSGQVKSSIRSSIIPIFPEMSDIDGDSRPEIFGAMSASGNYLTTEPFSDSSTWFMVFNDHLDFEFPPVRFPGFANGMQTAPFNSGFAILHWAGGADTAVMRSRIMLYTKGGSLIRERILRELEPGSSPALYVSKHPDSEKIIVFGKRIMVFNSRLENTRQADLPFSYPYFFYHADLDNDGYDEFILYSWDYGRFVIYNEELKKIADQQLVTPSYIWNISKAVIKKGSERMYIKSGDLGVFMKLHKKKNYYLGYLAYPTIYICLLLFIFLIRKLNTLQIVRKEQLKQRLVTLQLQGIKSQLDPHFTFNTLNSVASMIYLQDREAAYDYLNKFTKLLRSMVNDAERIYRQLWEEIEFVTTYLELEKLRFGEKFDFRIETGEGLTLKEEVPKLVLYTFAENAVKHGIMPSSKGGMLRILISREDDSLKILIEDNGIGRSGAGRQVKPSGKGLKLTGEFYDILNELNKDPIRHSIIDLVDGKGNPSGTRVEIHVPLNVNQSV